MQRPLLFTIIPIPTGLSRGRALGKGIAAPVCTPRALASRRGLACNDKVRRGGRLCPPRMAAAPCRAGPPCPAGSNAYFAAGHMGPALRDLRLTHPLSSAKRTQIVNKCPLAALSRIKEFPFHSSNTRLCAIRMTKMRLIVYKSRVPALFSHRAPELKRRIKFSKLSYFTLICN